MLIIIIIYPKLSELLFKKDVAKYHKLILIYDLMSIIPIYY